MEILHREVILAENSMPGNIGTFLVNTGYVDDAVLGDGREGGTA